MSRSVLVLAVLVSSGACSSVVRQGSGSAYLVIDQLQGAGGGSRSGPVSSPTFSGNTLNSDVVTQVTSPLPCTPNSPCPTVFDDFGQATFRLAPKDVTLTPTTNNDVTITRYHVDFVRADGRNIQGVDVPYSFDGGATGTVRSDEQTILQFELVRHAAKLESPLVELQVNPQIISTLAQITFYGRDVTGHDVSVSGSMSVNFADFGDR